MSLCSLDVDSARGAIEKGDCPTACTAEEKQIIANILVTVRDKYPDQWKRVTDHFKPTPEQTTKFEEFLKQGKAYE